MPLAEHCTFAQAVQLWAAGVTLFLFASALVGYIVRGVKQDTENQFQKRNFTTTWAMYVLIAGEVTGVSVLLAGVVVGLQQGS